MVLLFAGTSQIRAHEGTLTSEEIYQLIAPAVPLIETPLGSGSGILISDRHVLTDAHVVWPYSTASVRFAGSPAIENVKVIAWDHMIDLAVLELPAASSAIPVEVVDAGTVPVGSQLFAVGYPGVVEGTPSPIISVGLVSRFRDWSSGGVTFVESDAAAFFGMSGGALVTGQGKLVAITQFGVNARFVLGVSAFDAKSRMDRALLGVDADQVGVRFPEARPAAGTAHQGTLDHGYDADVYVVPAGSRGSMTATLQSTTDTALLFLAPWGELVRVSDLLVTGGTEEFSIELESGQPGFVTVRNWESSPTDYTLTSTVPLAPLNDPDDGRVLNGTRGDVFGNTDSPWDLDTFRIQLDTGDLLTVTADSLRIDPIVQIDQAGNPGPALAQDDDGGGGFWGLASRVEFTAPVTGEYLIIIGDVLGDSVGGYVLNASIAGPEGPSTGTFASSLPASGVGLAVWGGGDIAEIEAAAAGTACNNSSFWVSQDGTFIGYLFGAPEFVNEQPLALFPDGVFPNGTAMLVICEAA